ncbi:MAG: caspase family protein [Pseudomonadota bacterium]
MLRTVLLFALMIFPALAQASGKHALVIGIGDYENIRSLRNPVPDAMLASATFERLGFATQVATDLDADALRAQLDAFNVRSTGAEVALIYFAGHGMQIDGANYLLATDALGASQGAAVESAVSTDELIAAFGAGAGAKILLVDACRDNPFADDTRSLLSGAKDGLARLNHAASDLLVVFAAQPGTVALDGEGDNSPFMTAVSDILGRSDAVVSFQDALIDITNHVRTNTGDRQTPYIEGTLSFRIELAPATPPAPEPMNAALTCEGGRVELPITPHADGYVELDGTVALMDFGGEAEVCIGENKIEVVGTFSQDFSCEQIVGSGAGYYFNAADGTRQHFWFYVDPDAAPRALQMGVYRDDEELYWLATQRAICQP